MVDFQQTSQEIFMSASTEGDEELLALLEKLTGNHRLIGEFILAHHNEYMRNLSAVMSGSNRDLREAVSAQYQSSHRPREVSTRVEVARDPVATPEPLPDRRVRESYRPLFPVVVFPQRIVIDPYSADVGRGRHGDRPFSPFAQ
jgi:hypothetical protein